jgi:hypothetical protein
VRAKLSYQAMHCKTRTRAQSGLQAPEPSYRRKNLECENQNGEFAIQRRLEISIVLILQKLSRFLIGMLGRLEMHPQAALEVYFAWKNKWPISAD